MVSSDTLALLGKIRAHFCFPAVPAALPNVSACTGNFSGQREPQHGYCRTAAGSDRSIPAPADGFSDTNTAKLLHRRGQGKGLSSALLGQLPQVSHLGPRRSLYIRKDYSAQHMWWDEFGAPPQCYGSAHQLASKSPGFFTLAQSSWCLLVITTPNDKTFAGNSCNGWGLVQVPILLAFIIKGNIHIRHPPGNWTVWLRAFLMEATTTTNNHLITRKTSLQKAGGTSNLVLLAGPFSSSVTPTKRPTLSSMEGGSWRDSMCLVKACAAAFSLVTTMTLSVGSITSKPPIIAAAARVFPPPKTPLMGQSVLPSKMDCANEVSTAKKWQSGCVANGLMACSSAPSSSVNSFSEADALTARKANWSNFTEAANNRPRSPG